jgi:hypothetical protein
MEEYTWFLFILWIILFLIGLDVKNELVSLAGGLIGLFFSVILMQDVITALNYAGYLLFIINIVLMIFVTVKRR